MFCIKCGTANSDEAVYCIKCGNRFDDKEEETRVAVRGQAPLEHADEAAVFSIAPTLKFVKLGYVLAVIAAFVLVGVLSVFGVWWVISIILGMLLLLVPAYFNLRQKLVRYTLTDTTIEIDRGLISRSTQNIPLRRIQDVTVSTTVLQRLLGFGDIVIDNASETGGKIVLGNIDSPKKYADIMLKQIRHIER